MRSGHSAWSSCDVISWDAWLARCSATDRGSQPQGFRHLGTAEEWLLWRDAAAAACDGLEMLAPGSLADALRRSAALVRDWGMRWRGAPTPESAVLQRAQRLYADRCSALHVRAVSDWQHSLPRILAARAPLVFAGCGAMGAALEARLRELGAAFWPAAAQPDATASDQIVACADPADELRRAARWCREQLEHDPRARLLVVDPLLARRRALAIGIFSHELQGRDLLTGPGEAPFGVEGGQELPVYATVAAALRLLELGAGVVEFPQLAALLRSPYIHCGGGAARATLEIAMRERNVSRADSATLLALARSHRLPAGPELAAALASMAGTANGHAHRRESAGWWGRRFATLLEEAGWPGQLPLGSDEQQQCERFRDLLGEFSLLGSGSERFSCGQALELLRALAARTAFDSATGDLPVTLTASTDDPLAGYDGIWVAGLSAENWPMPPHPDPFVPLAVQRAVHLPAASPEGRHAAALEAMAAWRRCARLLVYSWSIAEEDVTQQPSSLLAGPARDGTQSSDLRVPRLADSLVGAMHQSAKRERRPVDRARPWPAAAQLRGGTRVLQLQALCPFRACAELRLGAVPVPEPVPGFDARERGQLLHRALELAWLQLGDSDALLRAAADGAALEALACAVAERALREALARRLVPAAAALLSNETLRIAARVVALLRDDQRRAQLSGFRALQLEQWQECAFAGRKLRVRMDRLDQLSDGRLVVIDYKSGTAESFRPLDERPRQPQLLAYALLAGEAVAGVAAAYLNADEVRWRGAAAADSTLPLPVGARAPTAPGRELLVHWRRVIERLVGDYAAGEAAVDPLPGACATCTLAALCRVDPARMQEPDPDEALTAGSGENIGAA
jgi:ATP-dependent helicase/nuclease subunit B